MLEAKKIREQKEEEQKKLLDIEEAKYQAEKRKEAITKATAQQFYHTDRVKAFHVRMILEVTYFYTCTCYVLFGVIT